LVIQDRPERHLSGSARHAKKTRAIASAGGGGLKEDPCATPPMTAAALMSGCDTGDAVSSRTPPKRATLGPTVLAVAHLKPSGSYSTALRPICPRLHHRLQSRRVISAVLLAPKLTSAKHRSPREIGMPAPNEAHLQHAGELMLVLKARSASACLARRIGRRPPVSQSMHITPSPLGQKSTSPFSLAPSSPRTPHARRTFGMQAAGDPPAVEASYVTPLAK